MRKVCLLWTSLVVACAPSPRPVGVQADAGSTSGDASNAPFIKHGDNGDAACDAFCAGSQWGRVGTCLGTMTTNLACSQAIGRLTNGAELVCTCESGAMFVKNGDDGTASCDVYCAGSQWGRVGTCIGAQLQANTNVLIDGNAVAYDDDCSILPGMLANAAELTCMCEGTASTP